MLYTYFLHVRCLCASFSFIAHLPALNEQDFHSGEREQIDRRGRWGKKNLISTNNNWKPKFCELVFKICVVSLAHTQKKQFSLQHILWQILFFPLPVYYFSVLFSPCFRAKQTSGIASWMWSLAHCTALSFLLYRSFIHFVLSLKQFPHTHTPSKDYLKSSTVRLPSFGLCERTNFFRTSNVIYWGRRYLGL